MSAETLRNTRHDRLLLVGIFAACLLVYNINLREIGGTDTIPSRLVPISLLTEGDVDLDEFSYADGVREGSRPYFIAIRGEHLVPGMGFVAGLLNLPFYVLPLLCGMDPQNGLAVALVAKLASSAWISVSVVFVFLSVVQITRRNWALLLTAFYAFGTGVWPVASQGAWQHVPSLLFLSIACYGVVRSDSTGGPWVLGAACALGAALAARAADLPVVATMLLYLLWRHRATAFEIVLVFGVPCAAQALINLYLYNSILGHHSLPLVTDQPGAKPGGAASLITTSPVGFLGLLISPSRGILIFSPAVMLSLSGVVVAWRHGPGWARAGSLAVAGLIALMSFYGHWWGGWTYGPRQLVDISGLLCLLAALAVPALMKSMLLRRLWLGLLVWSVCVQAIGAFNFEVTRWNASPTNVDTNHARLWDIRDNQIWRCLKLGPVMPEIIRLYREEPTWNAEGWLAQGILHATRDRPEAARRAWEEALRSDPYDPRVHHHLGLYWISKDNPGMAIECWKRAVELAPTHLPSLKALERWDGVPGDD